MSKRKNDKNAYLHYGMDDMMGIMSGGGLGFFNQLFASIERDAAIERKNKAKKLLGITENDEELIGSEKLGIPHQYFDFSLKNGFLHFYYSEEIKEDVYKFDKENMTVQFLFSGLSVEHIGKNWFLVETEEQPENMSYKLRKLMNTEGFVSEHFYHANSSTSFKDSEFCQLSCVEVKDGPRKYATVVVNSEGKEVFMNSGMLDYLYITGCIVSSKKGYTNLLTGELITNKTSSTLKTKNFMFLGSSYGSEEVLKVNIHTGEVETFN